jgi:hypothetical protein
MPTNTYDVLVYGDDLAGLVAAALCARRGMRVLVAQTAQTMPDKYTQGAYTLPRTPLAFVGESSPAIRRVVAELNFVQTLKRRLLPLRPQVQIVLPDGRIELSPDADPLGRELDRELPDARTALEFFFARAADVSRVLEPVFGQDIAFPPDGFFEKREIPRLAARPPLASEPLLPDLPAGHPARAFVTLPAAFSGSADPRTLSPTAIARSFDLWRRGVARVEGGRDALRQLLLEKLRTQHAGEVQLVDPAGISQSWGGRASGLALADRDETLGFGHFLHAGPLAELGDLFGDKRPKRILQLGKGILPTAYRFVVNLVVAEAGIPEGISPITLAVWDPAAPLLGDNAIAIHLGDPDDDARVVVSVVANAPAPGDGRTLEDVLAALRPRILARVEEIMPFSSEHTLLWHSPNLGPNPLLPEPLWTSTLPTALGVSGLPYDVGVKGICVASTQNLPGLGLEGDFAAGWSAAKIVSGNLGKKKDYLKDEVLLGS